MKKVALAVVVLAAGAAASSAPAAGVGRRTVFSRSFAAVD
jgi:hypothetical protein